MSFFLERLRLMYPIQRLVGQINEAGRVKYSFVMECVDRDRAADRADWRARSRRAHQEYEHIIQSTPLPFREDDEDLRGKISPAEWLQMCVT